MQRKNDGGKKIQLWLANDITAEEVLLFATKVEKGRVPPRRFGL